MISNSESEPSGEDEAARSKQPRWLKVGVVAAVSALSAGLAVAWWYRKSVEKLREAEEMGKNPVFGISEDEPAERP
jgi:hypothetical protein